jgi:hypothetical protein
VEWTRSAFERVIRSQPSRKIVFLTLVEPGCEIASSEVRRDMAELLETYAGQLACAAIVLEDSGFRMTILRSIITAIDLASRTRFPNSVFSKVDSALTWIVNQSRTANSTTNHRGLPTSLLVAVRGVCIAEASR